MPPFLTTLLSFHGDFSGGKRKAFFFLFLAKYQKKKKKKKNSGVNNRPFFLPFENVDLFDNMMLRTQSLKRLTSSVSVALDEAAVMLNKMRTADPPGDGR